MFEPSLGTRLALFAAVQHAAVMARGLRAARAWWTSVKANALKEKPCERAEGSGPGRPGTTGKIIARPVLRKIMRVLSVVLCGGADSGRWPASLSVAHEGSTQNTKQVVDVPKAGRHRVVVAGMTTIQVGDVEYDPLPGQYRYIPLKEKHRLNDMVKDELALIETQCSGYLGEEDIVCLADTYGHA